MDTFLHDLVCAWRAARKNPAVTIVVVLTLACGIGAAVTVFSIVDAWLLRPLSFPEPNRLVIAFAADRERPTEPAVFLPYRSYLGWKERSRSFQLVSAAFRRSYLMSGKNDATTALGMAVTAEFFQTLGVPALHGRTLSSRDAHRPPAAVLTHGLWERQFGASAAAIGSRVTLNGDVHEVVGVMPRHFDVRVLDQDRGFELFTLFGPREAEYAPGGTGPVAIIGRLRHDVSPAAAQAELDLIHREIESTHARNLKQFVVLLTPLQADNTRTVRTTLITVSGAVACLLLIACLNVGTLQLGRGLGRAREAAIRAALGSGVRRLIRQFLTEPLVLSAIGGACGLLLALIGTRLFVAWNPLGTLPPSAIRIDLRVFGFALGTVIVSAIACGLLPALRLASTDPMEALRTGGERGTVGAPRQRTQQLLLAGQLAVSVVLLVATTLLVRTFVRLQSEHLGFEPSNLTVVSLALPTHEFDSSQKRNAFYAQLAEKVAGLAGVQRVAAGTVPPLSSGPPIPVKRGADPSERDLRAKAQEVTNGFFETVGIPLLAGRAFDIRDTAASPGVVVLNESAATAIFGGTGRAVGSRLLVGQDWREVIGIVGSARSVFFNTLEWVTNPIVYLPSTQAFSVVRDPTIRSFGFHLHVRSAHPLTMTQIKAAIGSLSSSVAVGEIISARDAISKATRQPALRMVLLGWFGAASLLLAAMGVYGLVSQAVAQRAREIGVRLALGARVSDVIRVVAGRTVLAAAAGALVGSAAALALGTGMESLLYGVRAADALSFVTAGMALLAVTVVAAVVPAFRATKINPTDVLRSD